MAESSYPLPMRRMTPDDVLAVFLHEHGQQIHDFELDRDSVFGFDTTIEEWQDAWDLVDTKSLGRAFNEQFDTTFSDARWRAVLEPARSRTVRGVCELIATEAQVAQIQPFRVFGKPCLPAGAFLTIRSLLAKAGVDVADVKPSTPLGPYLREHGNAMMTQLVKLAPGRLPFWDIENNAVYESGFRLLLASIVLGPLGLFTAWLCGVPDEFFVLVLLPFVGLFLLGYVLTNVGAVRPAKRVDLGNLRDFRDLSYAVVGQDPPMRWVPVHHRV